LAVFLDGWKLASSECMLSDPDALDGLTEQIIACAITVHNTLGPGLLESIYQRCMVMELRARALSVETERSVPVIYRGEAIESHFKVDLVIEESVVVELKAITAFAPVHHAQVITYLKLTGCPVGLLINFNVTSVRNGLRRVMRPDLYKKALVPPVPPA
jgi:GxxExxY protein